MNHQYIVMWDCNGLEYLGNVTADEQRVMWGKLQGKESPRHALANPLHMRLRAQANPQRNYEIYIFDVAEGITEQDVRDMFDASPQTAADTIRRIGHCFYSNRMSTKERAIV